MQIQLEPDVEAALAREGAALGITSSELSAKLLREHAQTENRHRMSDKERDEFLEEYSARMKAANPDYETHDPRTVDWPAIKAQGRKY